MGDFQFRGSDIEPAPASEQVTVNASAAVEKGDLCILTAGLLTKGAADEIPTHLAMGAAAVDIVTIALPLHKGMIMQGVYTGTAPAQGAAVGLVVTTAVQTFGVGAITKCADVVKVLDSTNKVALFRMRNAAVSA